MLWVSIYRFTAKDQREGQAINFQNIKKAGIYRNKVNGMHMAFNTSGIMLLWDDEVK